ncbi:hypothetical protein BH11PSE11_BH11PSE11_15030 [soil metagenome]
MSLWTVAFGMMLLLEGIVPFLFPKLWREAFSRITQLTDGQIRFYGLIALIFGIAILGLAQIYS